jgi:L-asparaginase II
MQNAAPLIEIWRGDLLESAHSGHAVICNAAGEIMSAWGDPAAVIYPRSSCKMLQALPLIESGAAAAVGLTPAQLALSCASHQGAAIHTDPVTVWLDTLGISQDALRCGPQEPSDLSARNGLVKADRSPCQIHNNCSGKHAGFLTFTQYSGWGPEYHEPTHPLQTAIKQAFEEVTQETSPMFAIDGCSAPNHATTVHGLARAMASFASAHNRSDVRSKAASALVDAMRTHPELVAGETRACTELMRAMDGKVAIKTGAEGVFVAIIPEQQLGIALKAKDGATRAAEGTIAALLIKLGVLDANHPAARKRINAEIRNWNGMLTGYIRPADGLM